MTNKGIYKILNKLNNKVYYGSTTESFGERWSDHKSDLRYNRHGNKHLQAAWNKYGSDIFEFSIVLKCSPEECLMYEQMYLDLYWDNGVNCYNICPIAGNSRGRSWSEEQRQKMIGRKFSEETRKKISLSSKGRKHSAEARSKISAALSHKKKPAMTEEHKANLSAAHTGKVYSIERKLKVAKLTIDAVQKIRQLKNQGLTQQTIAKIFNVSRGAVANILQGRTWTTV